MIQLRTNANQVILGLTQKILDPERLDNAIRTVATTMLAEMKTRVFEQGKKTDSSDIGKYSTTPMYVSVNANPGKSFGAIGKTGKSKFKSGKSHTSRYFAGGYNEYKAKIGRNPGYVNLSLSGQLNSQMTIIGTPKGYGIGWTNKEMFERAGHFTKKYGQIWHLTEEEKTLAREIAQREFINSLN